MAGREGASRELPRLEAGQVERRAAKGGLVTIAAQVIKSVVEGAGMLVLARTLIPADFGLVDMIVSITGIIDLLKDFGLSTATIQKDRIDHGQVSVLFWINVAMGLALTLITLALAPFIAVAYDKPELLQLTLCLSLSTLLGSLSVQHIALLRRDLRFSQLGIIDVVCAVGSTGLAVLAAFRGYGPWALVVRQLVRLGLQAVLSFVFCSFRPGPPRRADVRELLRFGTNLSGFQLVNYLERNLDNVLVGRFAGAEALAFYSKAYDIMRLPLSQINGPITTVAIPALSRLTQHPERYRNVYRSVATLLMLITVPLAPLSCLAADYLIPAVLGPQWTGTVPIFQVLALTLLTKPLANTTGWIFVSQARTGELLRWGLVAGVIATLSFAAGLPWGALGVAVVYSLTDTFIRMPILFWWTGRTGPVSTRDLLACLVPGWFCAAVVAIVYLALGRFFVESGTRFAVCGPASLLAGYALLFATPWGRRTARDGLRMLRSLRKTGTPPPAEPA